MLPGKEDEAIWRYFADTAFPPEAQVRQTLAALAGAGRPLSVPALEAMVDLRRTRLETLLKVLDVDGAVERTDGGWLATGRPWEYDAQRYAGIAAARRREQQVMRAYQEGRTCLMSVLRTELDDPGAADPAAARCGRCSVCTGRLPAPGREPDAGTVRAAWQHLKAQQVVLEPRKMWPAGAPRRGRIAESLRAEPGRALSKGEDAIWAEPVRAALDGGAPVPDEVFAGLVEVLKRWGWPAGRPSWVTWVPSRRREQLLADAATRLAGLGRMELATPLVATGPGFQGDQATNADAAGLALRRLAIDGPVPDGPVLVLDDTSRSGFTLTVAAALLREAGAGPVYPLVLHREF
jgi:ATP-dependent DNA helicase RecQ